MTRMGDPPSRSPDTRLARDALFLAAGHGFLVQNSAGDEAVVRLLSACWLVDVNEITVKKRGKCRFVWKGSCVISTPDDVTDGFLRPQLGSGWNGFEASGWAAMFLPFTSWDRVRAVVSHTPPTYPIPSAVRQC